MKTALKTAPTLYPISMKEVKDHLRIILGNTDEDDYLKRLIKSGVNYAQLFLRRRLITQTWYYYPDDFPAGDVIVIPYGQLQSMTSLKYSDTDGTESTMTASEYIVDIKQDPGRIVLAYGESWPTDTLYPSNPITIEYVCGYGLTSADVPEEIKQAILLFISDLYENREAVFIGQGFTLTKTGAIDQLLWPYRIHKVIS